MSAVLRVAKSRDITVYLVDLVLEEAVGGRVRDAEEALEKLAAAINQASKVVSLDDIYLPSAAAAGQEWRDELVAAFRISECHVDDAREALWREARRDKPANSKGIGARDSAIWLTVKRHHVSDDKPTSFVSSNTNDFAEPRDAGALHRDLAADLGERADAFTYFTKLDDLIAALATPVESESVNTTLSDDIRASLLGQILPMPEFVQAYEDIGALAPDATLEAGLVVRDVWCLRAYALGGHGLVAFLKIDITIQLPLRDGRLLGFSMEARAWAELAEDDGDIHSLALENLSPNWV
jgi:PIN domain